MVYNAGHGEWVTIKDSSGDIKRFIVIATRISENGDGSVEYLVGDGSRDGLWVTQEELCQVKSRLVG